MIEMFDFLKVKILKKGKSFWEISPNEMDYLISANNFMEYFTSKLETKSHPPPQTIKTNSKSINMLI